MSAPRVVIVGGGFGGLFATRALAGAAVNVVLIDKRNYHLFRPMLYQVATGLLSADQIAVPLRSIVSRQQNVEVLQDEVTAIDSAQRLIRLKQHQLPYDFLILATGIQYNYFGHDDWRRVAPGLESLDDADLIRGKVLTAFEQAEETAALDHANSEEVQRLLTFVLVGAGTVGIEMASTLAEMSRIALRHDFRHIDPRSARILLYEAAPRVLPTFPEVLSAKAQRHLESLGVEVYTNTRVTSVDEGGIVADGKRVPARTVLWGAGVLASPAARWLGAAMDRSGKIIVNADMSVPGHPEIFAIGDTAHVVAESRNLLGIKLKGPVTMPGVAQPAIQEGQYVARLFNSYYNSLGDAIPDKASRSCLSRPSLDEVLAFRRQVDDAMETILADPGNGELERRIVLGLNHEQQHQELMLTDIKHALFSTPFRPAYCPTPLARERGSESTENTWHNFRGGLVEIGRSPDLTNAMDFCFDNESPRHKVYLENFGISGRGVTCREYLNFMADDGYARPEFWLSEGWDAVRREGWISPLYWERDATDATGWRVFTLKGSQPLSALLETAVCHVSYFEADAFAKWSGHRLPTEQEWEFAAIQNPITGNFLDTGRLHTGASKGAGIEQLFGDCWEWTASAYTAYPGYNAPPGAFGEYNG